MIICVITIEREKSNFTPGGHDEANVDATFDDIMTGAGLTGEDMATVPRKCRDCPVLKHNLGGIACMRQEVQEGLSIDTEQVKQRLLMMREAGHEALVSLTDDQIGQMATSATAHKQREVMEILDSFDRQSAKLQAGVDRLTSHCAGPLKMRGSRDGKEVITTSCMSARVAHPGETSFADVHYS